MHENIQKLNVVNDQDEIIGTESRDTIHQGGLLHREIHVWFYTPSGEVIFQHRAKDTDTYPDLLDATVGGHVEMGDSYVETAVKETQEETGVKINVDDLISLIKIKRRSEDSVTGMINNAFKQEFAYLYRGDIETLRIEKGKSLGFESHAIDAILDADDELKRRFIPGIFSPGVRKLFEKLKTLVTETGQFRR